MDHAICLNGLVNLTCPFGQGASGASSSNIVGSPYVVCCVSRGPRMLWLPLSQTYITPEDSLPQGPSGHAYSIRRGDQTPTDSQSECRWCLTPKGKRERWVSHLQRAPRRLLVRGDPSGVHFHRAKNGSPARRRSPMPKACQACSKEQSGCGANASRKHGSSRSWRLDCSVPRRLPLLKNAIHPPKRSHLRPHHRILDAIRWLNGRHSPGD